MEIKKNPEIDTFKQMPVYWTAGLVIALVLIITAFEWKSYDEENTDNQEAVMIMRDQEALPEIPPTVFVPPPPTPVVQEPELKEVPDEKEIKKEVEMTKQEDAPVISTPIDAPTGDVPIITAAPVEDVNQVFTFAEEQPEPEGGYTAFYKYVEKNLKYPSQARRQNIQGKVFVSFVVERDGSITDVKVTRGIGGGCDEEAERVLRGAPKWKPGKQRHKPVRVKMSIPIGFKLN